MDSSTRTRLDQHLINVRVKLFRAINGGSVEIVREWMRAYSGLSVPSFNIFQPLTEAGLTDDALADNAAFFMWHKTLYTVELIHDKFPEGPDYLDQLGYQALPPHLAMYFDGSKTVDSDLKLNHAVSVIPVTNVPSLTAYCTLLHQVFDYSLEDMITFYSVYHLGEELRDIIRHYLVFADEQPVGAGTLICLDGVASISNVCTVDAYRRQHIATTLLHQMLLDADSHGCSLKGVYSTPDAYNLFNKFDFEIYTQRQWFLPPDIEFQEW